MRKYLEAEESDWETREIFGDGRMTWKMGECSRDKKNRSEMEECQ